MKNKFFAILFLFSFTVIKAQYGTINAILDRLEEKRGINTNLTTINFEDLRFVLIKEFEDHTERKFVVIKGNSATYIEVFDDKKTGESSSNVFSGDIVRSKHQVISLRADRLEGKKMPIPVTKTFLLTEQKNILYLIDANSKERWIEESAINKK
jgi:hypothetical protein